MNTGEDDLLLPYLSILELSHPEKLLRPRMSVGDRAAQFAPYAALVGYSDFIQEAERLTDRDHGLTEEEQLEIVERLNLAEDMKGENCPLTFVVFRPDSRKEGGSLETVTSPLRRLDRENGEIHLENGQRLPVSQIRSVDGILFHMAENG